MPSVLVTGAGHGIGLSITRHLSARGWDVHATARNDADLARLEAVVNNAGIIVSGPVEGLTLDDLSRQLDINLTSQIGVTQAVLPLLRESSGRIVFMSSVSGLITLPGTGAYSASKYALESLADALRIELRPWDIRVSLIEPGPTRTDMWGDALVDHDRMVEKLAPQHRELYASHLAGNRRPLGRFQKLAGSPDKVVKAVDRALTSRRPRRRYLTDSLSRVQKNLLAVTPTGVSDATFAALTTTRRP